MKRQLWGEISDRLDEATVAKQIETDREMMMEKRGKYKIIKSNLEQ
jgi:hypothetical protein